MELRWRFFGAQETEALVEHFESNSWEVRRSPFVDVASIFLLFRGADSKTFKRNQSKVKVIP